MKELPERWVRDSGRSVGGVQGASLLWRLFEVTYVLPVCLDSARMGTGLGNRVTEFLWACQVWAVQHWAALLGTGWAGQVASRHRLDCLLQMPELTSLPSPEILTASPFFRLSEQAAMRPGK